MPKKRTVEEIWEEDDHVKDKYKIITDEDDDVAVTGPGSHLYNGKEYICFTYWLKYQNKIT